MAENKKSFLLYAEYLSTFEELSEEEAGRLIKHILRYVNDQDPEAPDRLTKIAFEPIKQNLRRDLQKWENKREVRAKAGAKGGAKSVEAKSSKIKQNQANDDFANQNEAKQHFAKSDQANQAVNVNANVNVNVIDQDLLIVDDVVDACENLENQKIEKTEYVPADVFVNEDEKLAALDFLKKHSSFPLIQKNHKITSQEVLRLFDVFFDQKVALNEQKQWKSKDDIIKNFFWWVPKHIQAQPKQQNQSSNGTSNHNTGRTRSGAAAADSARADRHETLGKLRGLLQGTAPQQ